MSPASVAHLSLGAIMRDLVPRLPAEAEKELLLDTFAQQIAFYHHELMKDTPAPVLSDPRTPFATVERYRCVARQALQLAEYSVAIDEGDGQ